MHVVQQARKSGKAGKGEKKYSIIDFKRRSTRQYPNGQITVVVNGGPDGIFPQTPKDPKKQKKSFGRVSAPIIPRGNYPSCCTICTRKFYHGLALLQLPEHLERATLQNFHNKYRDVLGSFDTTKLQKKTRRKDSNSNQPKQGSSTSRFIESDVWLGGSRDTNVHVANGRRASKGGAIKPTSSQKSKKSKKYARKKSGAGSGFNNIAKSLAKGSKKRGKDQQAQSASNVGPNDITQRLENSIKLAKRVPGELKKTWVGQQGPGPCCNICPTWFVPYNSGKHWSRGVPGVPSYSGAEVESSAHKHLSFLETMERQRAEDSDVEKRESATHENENNPLGNGGFSQCCNVCTSGDGEIPLKYSMFLEIKDEALSKGRAGQATGISTSLHSTMHNRHGGFLRAMGKGKMQAPARQGQCCYMCTINANGGWENTQPFSEPQSEPQSVESEYTSDETMRKIAFWRSFFHEETVDHDYVDNKAPPKGS